MLTRARAKASSAGMHVAFVRGDAPAPPVSGPFDVVLCRHVLWALPQPEQALRRWRTLLRPHGRLVPVEGRWSTGAGITAAQLLPSVERTVGPADLEPSSDPRLWGRSATAGELVEVPHDGVADFLAQVQHAVFADVDADVRAVRIRLGVEEHQVKGIGPVDDLGRGAVRPQLAEAQRRQVAAEQAESGIGVALAVRAGGRPRCRTSLSGRAAALLRRRGSGPPRRRRGRDARVRPRCRSR